MTARVSPLNRLPAYRKLDRTTHDALMAAWAAVNYREMTTSEIEQVVGAPLETPQIKVEFGTGKYPANGVDA